VIVGTKYGKIVGFKVPSKPLSFHPSVSSIQKGYARRDLTSNKVVILTFGDGRKSQFTNAKPILDKYGFKASFYSMQLGRTEFSDELARYRTIA
jgi:peptidoglycan/xylan/chitin deacetylase (PgdA/CDA1 family)